MTARRLPLGVLLFAVVAVSAGGCSKGVTADIEGYRVGPGHNQITVFYGSGPDDQLAAAEVLEQTPLDIRIRVSYHRARGAQDSDLVTKAVVVTLDRDLEGRAVLDQTGHSIALVDWRLVPQPTG